MELGLLTAPFGKRPLDEVIEFAADAGFDALEVAAGPGSTHIDPAKVDQGAADSIRSLLEEADLKITSLAYYANVTDADADRRRGIIEHLIRAVDAAALLEIPVVCTTAGMPVPGKDKMKTIEEELPGALRPVLDRAGEKGIKLAFENWFATNIQNLDHWKRVFEVIPDAHLGLNFDPSHLVWQGIDHLEAVREFGPRIFHTHAKDVEINEHKLRRCGNQVGGWWRYVIPGFGLIHWGRYIGALKSVGYHGVLSIEHEDSAFGVEDGFEAGAGFLSLYV